MLSKAFGQLAIVSLALGLAACVVDSAERTSPAIRIASGPRDGTYFIIGDAMAALFSQRLPDVRAVAAEGRGVNSDALQDGDAECGLMQADTAYLAYSQGTIRIRAPHTRLRGVAVLFPTVLHVVSGSRVHVNRIGQLSGFHVGAAVVREPSPHQIGPRDKAVIDTALELSGRTPAQAPMPKVREIALEQAVTKLESGEIDVAFLYGGQPFFPVTEFTERNDATFLDFDEQTTSALKARYPFFKPAVIPAGTYRGQDRDVHTVAIDNLLVCRADVPADLIYRITRTLHEGLPVLAAAHPSGRHINTEDGPATPIPLHEGAKRFYRERELFR